MVKKAMVGEDFTVFGDDYETPDGTNIRDYVHVLDLADNHTLALNYLFNGGQSNFYNVGIGRGYSNKEIIAEVEKVTGLKINVNYGDRRDGDPAVLTASIDKIKKELGWSPKYGLEEIVKSAYLWHKTHPTGYN
jgi:UDP-glucose 4-epimerase